MAFETIERGIGKGAGVAAGAAVAYKVWSNRSRSARLESLPEGGLVQSLLPFYRDLPDIATDCGIVQFASSGGLTKKALTDPMTEFDVSAREYAVTNAKSSTIEKSTLYREGEGTLRDFDIRVFKLLVDGEVQEADATLDADSGVKKQRKSRMQALLNDRATELGFPLGPEVSLFFYEEEFGAFRPWHYATRTVYDVESDVETIFSTTGHSMSQTRDEMWTCVVDLPGEETIRIPVDSPVTHLGRTLVRPLVERQRDRKDVDDAILNIRAKGLADGILGDRWEKFVSFRKWLDTALSSNQIGKRFERDDIAVGFNMLLARYVGVPLAPAIENSELGAVIRDPNHWIGKLASKNMGA